MKTGFITGFKQSHRLRYDFVLYSLNIAESCNTSFLTYSMPQYVNTSLGADVGLTVSRTLSCSFAGLRFKGISLCFTLHTLLKTGVPEVSTSDQIQSGSPQVGFL